MWGLSDSQAAFDERTCASSRSQKNSAACKKPVVSHLKQPAVLTTRSKIGQRRSRCTQRAATSLDTTHNSKKAARRLLRRAAGVLIVLPRQISVPAYAERGRSSAIDFKQARAALAAADAHCHNAHSALRRRSSCRMWPVRRAPVIPKGWPPSVFRLYAFYSRSDGERCSCRVA
jgi:hypothetical protein